MEGGHKKQADKPRETNQGAESAAPTKFKIFERDPRKLTDSWRLASYDEVNVKQIIEDGILDPHDSVRLLDGFIYKSEKKVEYIQHNFDKMLAVDTGKKRPENSTSFPDDLYVGTEEPKSDGRWKTERRRTALILSCQDKNTEVILWVLRNLEKDKFDDLMEKLKTTLSGDRTVLHYAVDQPYHKQYENYLGEIVQLLWEKFNNSGRDLVKIHDKQKKTALHYAACHGHIHLCEIFIKVCGLRIDDKDRNGENILHIAADRANSDLVNALSRWDSELAISTEISTPDNKGNFYNAISSQDIKGKTPLHKAAAKGKLEIVQFLVERLENYIRGRTPEGSSVPKTLSPKKYVRLADIYGQTALHEAAREGYIEVVKYLLEKGSRPLHERSADGKTALHYAVQFSDELGKNLIDLLLPDGMSDEKKYLLLSAFASGVGTASQSAKSNEIREHLENKRGDLEQKEPLLWTMVIHGYVKMALEHVNRGANVKGVRVLFKEKKKNLTPLQQNHVEKFLEHIKETPERGRDQPATEDSLGRSAFAEGLAALFLNPFIKSPLTVGIFGVLGMGKSSIMRQTENLLLREAAQLAFPDLLEKTIIPGSEGFDRPQNWHYNKLRLAITSLTKDEHGLVHILNKYVEKREKLYRFLALMDRSYLFAEEHSLAKIPSILTVWYNAWHYKKDMEALAGLVVQITKVIEETMTTAQRIRICCKYAWKQQRAKIWLQFILPCLLGVVSAVVVSCVAWSVLNRSNVKEIEAIKYGSIPLSIVVIVWTVLKQLFSVFKPISDQVTGYVKANDHNENLGYQQRVIDDIEYLKTKITEEPCWLWKIMSWIWNLLNFSPCADMVEGTWIHKLHSACPRDGNLRIIVFVDDLDRCEDEVILQVLSAVNLVLAVCKIDVILGVDKTMLSRVITKTYGNNNSQAKTAEDPAEKYISKIIQLPLALPDLDDTGSKTYLKQQMGPAIEGTDGDSDSDVHKPQSSEDVKEEKTQPCSRISRQYTQRLQRIWRTQTILSFFFKRIWRTQTISSFFFKRGDNSDNGEADSLLGSENLTVKNMTLMQCYMPNLSDEEQRVMLELMKVTTDTRRLPREWKRFFTYHRLAWNILSKKDEIKELPGWHVQLVVWLFCCWQWKEQINDVIKDWKNIVRVEPHTNDMDEILSVEPPTNDIKEDEYPSLKSIVDHYMKSQKQKQNQNQNQETPSEDKEWMALSETLRKYDVSIEGIRCFQDFRLHCEVGRLL